MLTFDPHHELLGIPPTEQPASFYRLLGLTEFEESPQVIANAAARQLRFVRQLAHGPYVDASQELLNQLATAKVCLLDPSRKWQYDQELAALNGSQLHGTTSNRETVEDTNSDIPVPPLGPVSSRRSWTIGCDPGCDIVVQSPTVSRLHCRLSLRRECWSLTDLDSTNGTYVNGRRLNRRCRVVRDDTVTLGQTVVLPWPRLE